MNILVKSSNVLDHLAGEGMKDYKILIILREQTGGSESTLNSFGRKIRACSGIKEMVVKPMKQAVMNA